MKEDRKTDGFKFALTALTTIGALLYAAVSYYQGTAIDLKYNDLFIELISVSLILFTNLLLYIFIKGYSLELHRYKDSDLIERNEKRASTIYILAFLTFIMLLSSIILIFVFRRLFGNLDSPLNYIIIFLYLFS